MWKLHDGFSVATGYFMGNVITELQKDREGLFMGHVMILGKPWGVILCVQRLKDKARLFSFVDGDVLRTTDAKCLLSCAAVCQPTCAWKCWLTTSEVSQHLRSGHFEL